MHWKNKVVWSEGMLLQQQHLQQHDRYLQNQLDLRCGTLQRDNWGLSRLTLDEGLLRQGKLALLECEAVLPDGTALSLPLYDAPPPPLEIAPEWRDCDIVLALPLARPGVAETGDGPYARYRIEEYDAVDDTDGDQGSTLLQVGRLQLRLAPAHEVADAYSTIAIARVLERRADNQVLLDPSFVPPCTDFQTAPPLARFARELAGLLHQRADALAERLNQSGAAGVARIADLLMLQTLNRNEPLWLHLAHSQGIHPRQLFGTLLQLSGELATFQPGKRPAATPRYLHRQLTQSFLPLIRTLRRQLEQVSDPSALAIALQPHAHGLHTARVPDASLFADADFVLAAGAELADELLVGRLPAQIKIGPVEKITDLVNLQLPAIGVRPLGQAPAEIPYHAGLRYFALDSEHPLWQQLPGSAALAVHLAGDFPGLRLELWAIRRTAETVAS